MSRIDLNESVFFGEKKDRIHFSALHKMQRYCAENGSPKAMTIVM